MVSAGSFAGSELRQCPAAYPSGLVCIHQRERDRHSPYVWMYVFVCIYIHTCVYIHTYMSRYSLPIGAGKERVKFQSEETSLSLCQPR
jgi:hypothetical protein